MYIIQNQFNLNGFLPCISHNIFNHYLCYSCSKNNNICVLISNNNSNIFNNDNIDASYVAIVDLVYNKSTTSLASFDDTNKCK